MSNRANPDPTTATRSSSSTSRKLIQAAALAAVLVPLGSVAVETASITCGFGYYYGGDSGCQASSPTSNQFNFGDYFFELTFADVGNFEVTVTTTVYEGLDTEAFPGYECIMLTSAGCVDFAVDTHGASSANGDWSHYSVAIDWEAWVGPVPEISRMRMLHDRSAFDGAEAEGVYDFDMCTGTEFNYDECTRELEPRIGSGNTDFDSFTAALAPIPEPSSLILLATGLGAAYIRRRRRSKV